MFTHVHHGIVDRLIAKLTSRTRTFSHFKKMSYAQRQIGLVCLD